MKMKGYREAMDVSRSKRLDTMMGKSQPKGKTKDSGHEDGDGRDAYAGGGRVKSKGAKTNINVIIAGGKGGQGKPSGGPPPMMDPDDDGPMVGKPPMAGGPPPGAGSPIGAGSPMPPMKRGGKVMGKMMGKMGRKK